MMSFLASKLMKEEKIVKSNYQELAQAIIVGVGGEDNIEKVFHCITRLRFTLKDIEKVNQEELEKLSAPKVPSVKAFYNTNLNQYHVVIGQAVEDVYTAVDSQLATKDFKNQTDKSAKLPKKQPQGFKEIISHYFQIIIGTITGSMIPVIGLLAAGGLINGLLAIFTKGNGLINVLDPHSTTYLLISTLSMVPFYFLPVLIGFSDAKQLKADPYVVAAVGAAMIAPNIRNIVSLDHPTVVNFTKGAIETANQAIAAAGVTTNGATAIANYDVHGVLTGWTVTAGKLFQMFGATGPTFNADYFGIPIVLPNYAYSIFPIIVAAAIAAPLGRWLKKVLPIALQPIFRPLITFFVTASIIFIGVGPVISMISSAFGSGVEFLIGNGQNVIQLGIAGLIIGGFYQCLVIFGLHWLVVPIISLQIATTGESSLNMLASYTMLAQGAGTLAVFLKTRKAPVKGLTLPAAISAFCGVTEPAMYGVNLKYPRVFIMSSIGAAVGAGAAGFLNLHMYGFSGSLIGFPNFAAKGVLNPTTQEWVNGNPNNFLVFWVTTILCITVSMALVWFFGYKDDDVMGTGIEKKNVFKNAVN
ncbi:PTS transporter subunit EIIC [Enterococcus faecalis]|uniref:PTS transporter subunit EIIC n=1 Tax=Enterococcus faecalis TaxID=1351 RepID=UPI002DB8D5E3|nr:PTS transporter subunit EIIC [Enterococcus faecalis]MEB5926166.1 PTS transporter subunit EIIC [Enterococcus faecalis]